MERFDITRVIGEEVINLNIADKMKVVHTKAGNHYQGRTLIIASGKLHALRRAGARACWDWCSLSCYLRRSLL